MKTEGHLTTLSFFVPWAGTGDAAHAGLQSNARCGGHGPAMNICFGKGVDGVLMEATTAGRGRVVQTYWEEKHATWRESHQQCREEPDGNLEWIGWLCFHCMIFSHNTSQQRGEERNPERTTELRQLFPQIPRRVRTSSVVGIWIWMRWMDRWIRESEIE